MHIEICCYYEDDVSLKLKIIIFGYLSAPITSFCQSVHMHLHHLSLLFCILCEVNSTHTVKRTVHLTCCHFKNVISANVMNDEHPVIHCITVMWKGNILKYFILFSFLHMLCSTSTDGQSVIFVQTKISLLCRQSSIAMYITNVF